MTGRKRFLGLLCHRPCLIPTWRGWLLMLVLAGASAALVIRGAYGFLAVNDSLPGDILVVEGWAPDYTIVEAVPEVRRNHYEAVYVTGGPIELGSPLLEYKTYADMATASLARLGMPGDLMRTVPAPAAMRDRTYASAVTLRKWLREHGITPRRINILGTGAHSRRTRLLYQKAFGSAIPVGVLPTRELDFDPNRWWASSQGFRIVLNEAIAYFYARFLFSPDAEVTGMPVPPGLKE
jgi:hypothetical protein